MKLQLFILVVTMFAFIFEIQAKDLTGFEEPQRNSKNQIKKSKNKTKSKKKEEKPQAPPIEYIHIPMPTVHLDVESRYLPLESQSKSLIEIQVSRWTPTLLNDDLYVNDQPYFDERPLSKASAHFIGHPWYSQKAFELKPVAGFMGAQASKTLTVYFHGNGSQVTENFNFFALKLGVELSTLDKFKGHWLPILKLHYLPVLWTQAASTEVNAAIDRTSTALEYSLGVSYSDARVSKALGFEDLAFELGFEKTTGFKDIPFEGSGAFFGTRIQL